MNRVGNYVSVGLWVVALGMVGSMLTGCASQEAYQTYNEAYKQSAGGYYEAASKPLVDITLPSPTGEPYHIVVNREIRPLTPEQIKNSEWTGPVNGLVSAAGMVGGIWAAGNAIGKITENAGGNSTYENSGTQTTQRDTFANGAGGTQTISVPTTTSTETTTSTTTGATP